jgi:hypothetical protein
MKEPIMSFRITGLPPEPFRPLFNLTQEELAAKGIKRYIADSKSTRLDRIEIRKAEPGEVVLLLNYTHQPANNPYHQSHAIYVAQGATQCYDRIDAVPEVLRTRTLSLRAYDKDDLIVDADLVEGPKLEGLIERFFANPEVAYIHTHYAKHGCYAGRIDRVS